MPTVGATHWREMLDGVIAATAKPVGALGAIAKVVPLIVAETVVSVLFWVETANWYVVKGRRLDAVAEVSPDGCPNGASAPPGGAING